MSYEETSNPLRKFKLVFLGEQSGERRESNRPTLARSTSSWENLVDYSVHVRQF